MWHFLIGLLIVTLWIAVIYFSPKAVEFLGRIEWAEKNVWWTKNAVVLFGFVVIVLWILFMFGVLQNGSPVAQW